METKKAQARGISRGNVEHKILERNWQEMSLKTEKRGRWWSNDLCHAMLLEIIMMR